MSCDNHIAYMNMMQQYLMDHCQSMEPFTSENGVTIRKMLNSCLHIYIYCYTNTMTQSAGQMPFYLVDDFIIMIVNLL